MCICIEDSFCAMAAKCGSNNDTRKSSAEILDEIFRELKEKSAKGELPSHPDISVVLGNTIANEEEDEHHKNVQKKKKKNGKHRHSYKHKKHKKHKKKRLRHSSSSSVEEWVPAETVISNNESINVQSSNKTMLKNDISTGVGTEHIVRLPCEVRHETDCDKDSAITESNQMIIAKVPELSGSDVAFSCKSCSPLLSEETKLDVSVEEKSFNTESELKNVIIKEDCVQPAPIVEEHSMERDSSHTEKENSKKRKKDDYDLKNYTVINDDKIQIEGPVVYSDSRVDHVKNNKEEISTSLKRKENSKANMSSSKSLKSTPKKLKYRSTSKHEDKADKNKKHSSSRNRETSLVSKSHSRIRHSHSPSVTKKKNPSTSKSKVSRSKSKSPHLTPVLKEKFHSSSTSRCRSRSKTRKRTSRSNSRESRRRDSRTSSKRSRWRRSPSKTRSSHAVILGEKIDKAKLLEIARKNAMAMMTEGKLPIPLPVEKPEPEKVTVKAAGKTVEELTDFCKLLSKKEKEEGECDDDNSAKPYHSSDEDDKGTPFVHHPFKLRDHQPNIIMNIRNAVQLPTKTPAEKAAESVKLRIQFPVSSGSQHRKKEWVPVSPKKESVVEQDKAKPIETVHHETEPAEAPSVDIGAIVSERLKAVRKLMENPNDVEALGQMYNSQQQMQYWAQSKQLPGQYTGTTDVQFLTPEELAGPAHLQAWVKKDQFNRAAPVQGGFGMYMLQKMGWKPGEGLGKNKEGTAEPLILDIKVDKKGLLSQGEIARRCGTPLAKDLSGKHPVSALVELCNKRHWLPPEFILVHDSGPDHKKNFVFKVRVNGQEYQPTIASPNKKHAKAQAATVCLQTLGLVPRDLNNPL